MKSKILLMLIFMAFSGFAQVPEIVWQQCYNYSGAQEGDKIPGILPEGDSYLVLFEVWDNENLPDFHGSFDIMVVETDSIGNVLRERCYGGTGQDISGKIIDAGNDTYYVLGRTNSTDGDVQSGNYGGSDIWVFKINGDGELLWERTYGSTGYDRAKDMIILPDGGFLIAGEISSGGGDVGTYYGDWDIWLCRCDSVGNILYETTLGNEGEDAVNGVLLNSEGNIILTGSIEEQGGTVTCEPMRLKDVWLTELDMQFHVLWDHCYGGSWDDVGYTVTEQDDGYLVLASSRSNNGDVSGHHGDWGNPDIWIFKTDAGQNIVWQKSLGGTREDIPASLIVDEEGDYFTVFGHTNSNDGDVSGNHQSAGTTSDIWAVQMSLEDEIQWQHCYGGIGNEMLASSYAVLKNESHGFIVAAQTDVSVSDDIRCTFYENTKSAWLIEIEKCPGYFPETPEIPSGPDTICTQNQQEHTYTIPPPANAWTFEWRLEPDTSGTLTNYGLYAVVNWNPTYEGTAAISARCANYCTESEWSEPKYTQVQTCLGTEETPAERVALRVYPNPAKEWVVFNFTLPNDKTEGVIKIVDAKGVFITSFTVTGKEGQKICDTRKLKPGIYFYTLNVSEYSRSGKIVISK